MDRYDPNEWTKDFVLSNKSFCVGFLKETNERIIELVEQKDYKASIAGLDRILNGLITMQNAGAGNCRPYICGLSFVEGVIIACGLSEASDDKRRECALKAFMDARDFSNGNMREFANQAISALESGIGFEKFKQDFDPDFPNGTVLDLLSDTTHKFDNLLNSKSSASSNNHSSGGCYVATAVYGSYDCPQVWTLRRYRDFSLASTWHGRLFIKLYYAVSPAIVKRFGKAKWFNRFWKSKLDKLVFRLNKNGFNNTPYHD